MVKIVDGEGKVDLLMGDHDQEQWPRDDLANANAVPQTDARQANENVIDSSCALCVSDPCLLQDLV